MRNVAILIFDQIEVLDFTGPYEVFNVTAELNTTTTPGGPPPLFNVYTVAESNAPVRTRGQLSVNPNYNLYDMPPPSIVIVPGGAGCRPLLQKPHILEWLQKQYCNPNVEYVLSVCTGSLVLAKAGIFDNLGGEFGNVRGGEAIEVTTHHDNLNDLQELLDERKDSIEGNVQVNNTKRYIVIEPTTTATAAPATTSSSSGSSGSSNNNNNHGKNHQHQPIVVTSGGISAGIDMCLYIVHKLCGNDVLNKTLNEMEYPFQLNNLDLTWKQGNSNSSSNNNNNDDDS